MAPMAPAYPKKAPVKPSQPMRQLHWGKLPDMKVKGTLWEKEVDDSKVAIDKDELESLFATKQPAKAGGADGEKKEPEETKGAGILLGTFSEPSPVGEKKEDKKKKGPEMANLLDAKTSQNTGIARARIKQPRARSAAHPRDTREMSRGCPRRVGRPMRSSLRRCARAAMGWMPTRSPRSSSERRAEIRPR